MNLDDLVPDAPEPVVLPVGVAGEARPDGIDVQLDGGGAYTFDPGTAPAVLASRTPRTEADLRAALRDVGASEEDVDRLVAARLAIRVPAGRPSEQITALSGFALYAIAAPADQDPGRSDGMLMSSPRTGTTLWVTSEVLHLLAHPDEADLGGLALDAAAARGTDPDVHARIILSQLPDLLLEGIVFLGWRGGD